MNRHWPPFDNLCVQQLFILCTFEKLFLYLCTLYACVTTFNTNLAQLKTTELFLILNAERWHPPPPTTTNNPLPYNNSDVWNVLFESGHSGWTAAGWQKTKITVTCLLLQTSSTWERLLSWRGSEGIPCLEPPSALLHHHPTFFGMFDMQLVLLGRCVFCPWLDQDYLC